MDEELARRLFLEPTQTPGRHYEILRGYFVEQRTLGDLATTCGMNYYTVRALVRRCRDQGRHGQAPPFWLSPAWDAPPRSRVSMLIRKHQPLPTADSCA